MMNNQERQRKIQSLTDQLKKLQASSSAGPSTSRPKRKQKPKKGGGQSAMSGDGTIRMRRSECLGSLRTDASGDVVAAGYSIHPAQLPFLKGLAANFEMVRWNAYSVRFVSSLGSTEGGFVSLGFKPNPSFATAVNRAKVLTLTPSLSCSAHQNSKKLVVPVSKLQPAKWFYLEAGALEDKQPGSIWVVVDGSKPNTAIGELWIEYDVTLTGTAAP